MRNRYTVPPQSAPYRVFDTFEDGFVTPREEFIYRHEAEDNAEMLNLRDKEERCAALRRAIDEMIRVRLAFDRDGFGEARVDDAKSALQRALEAALI